MCPGCCLYEIKIYIYIYERLQSGQLVLRPSFELGTPEYTSEMLLIEAVLSIRKRKEALYRSGDFAETCMQNK